MCESCGCNREEDYRVTAGPGHSTGFHVHRGEDGHAHVHGHEPAPARSLDVHQSLLSANDRLAERNRGFFRAKNVRVMNIMSSPGAGKTTLLARTLEELSASMGLAVIVGDLATENDAARLRGHGAEVVQVTTGTLCHLDAAMIGSALEALDLDAVDLLFIENVGNLVCPASFDLGESLRVVLLSVTEGEDKPLKYPPVFKAADLVVLTKTDLAEAAGFDRDNALTILRRVAPQAQVIELSARGGEGLSEWFRFIAAEVRAAEDVGGGTASRGE